MNLYAYINAQTKWSESTFGPGAIHDRVDGLIDHIQKELVEIKADPTDVMEWIDLIILALDGATRAGYSAGDICRALEYKQQINFDRQWPDWRTATPGKAIEHLRDHA